MTLQSSARNYHHLYTTPRWADLRLLVIAEAGARCQWAGCGRLCTGDRHSPNAAIGHHKTPHEGNEVLFYKRSNVMCVCKQCHDGPIRRIESGNRLQRDDGW